MNRQERRIIVAEARKLVKRTFPTLPTRAGCLYHAWAACIVGKQHGHRFLLQAGSAYWPCVAPEFDDGTSHNAFGYEFDRVAAAGATGLGILPEIHVWACDPMAAEVIDLTTGEWPEQAKALTGMVWSAPRPPDYLWARPDEFPKGVTYRATKDAAILAGELLKRTFGCGGD
jgi:hypothetical protein